MLTSKKWRLNNIYRIVDRNSSSIPFKLNKVQEEVLDGLHNRNIILKARQLGMSTFAVLYMLDEVLFNFNLAGGIVSYSLEHAQHIFKKIIGHALETLPKELKSMAGIVQQSAREITLSNGSSLRVDTTLRGGSYPIVLISEFGKTCARNPLKAEEVITGTLQTVSSTGRVIIESTGEGNEGFFADLVTESARRGNDNLTSLDYKLFFFPWMSEPTYRLQDKVIYDVSLTDYFNKIEAESRVSISQEQRNWYAVQKKVLGEKICQEYPSTVSEAFLSSSDAFYFAAAIAKAYDDNRCVHSSIYDALLPVYVAMDIGLNDLTVMVFFQLCHGEIRVIDYYEDKDKDVDFYAKFLLQDKKYLYNTIFLPHDSAKRDPLDIDNSYERDFRRLFAQTGTKFVVLKRMDKQLQISHARIKLDRCVFNVAKVKKYLDNLCKYRKKWNEATGRYLEDPLHNEACFVGETLIHTDKGQVRIDEIRVGDKVRTPNGCKTVSEVFKYKTTRLVKVSNGEESVICTPHHEFFTKRGIVTSDSLKYNDQIIKFEEEEIWKRIGYLGREKGLGFKEFFLSMKPEQLSSLMGINIKRTNLDIGLEGQQEVKREKETFIGLFGLIIKAKYLVNSTFITLTEINRIILSRILNSFHIPIICECTCHARNEKSCLEAMSEKQSKQLRHGMDQKMGLNGIASTEENALKKNHLSKENVFSVKKPLKQCKYGQSIAVRIVKQNIEEIPEKMTKKDSAKYVRESSYATSTTQKEHVQSHVELCLDIEREVYDLTVKDDHCYFANGFLVSNSNYSDCHQYMAQAVSHIETVSSMNGSMEKHRKVVESRHRILS